MNVDVQAAKTPVQTHIHIDTNKLDLRKVLTAFGIEKEGFGIINSQIQLSGTGDRLPEFMAHADGDVAMLMQKGRLDRLLVQLAGQDITGVLGALAGSDEATVKLRCLVSD